MNDGTPAPDGSSLPARPGCDGPGGPAQNYLSCLLALGQAGAGETGTTELARTAARLIVEWCADLTMAAVYHAGSSEGNATLLACAGTADPGSDLPASIELPQAGTGPEGVAVHEAGAGDTGALSASTLVVLRQAPGWPALGWLRLDADGPSTAARRLFALNAAQLLAGALAGAVARDTAHARAQALARRENAVSLYLGEVGDDLRTPLTLLLGPLEAAVERRADSSLAAALRHAQELRRRVDALFDLSLIDAGRVEPVLRPVDVAAMTRDIASLFQDAANDAGVALVIDCPRLPQAVRVDRAQWEQVVINLTGNAIRSSPSGEVRISLRAQPGLMTLEVSDTGPGIPSAELPHVFERFHRSPGRDDGGLGLTLVSELVRLHGGDVQASSPAGRGTRIRVCIPMLDMRPLLAPHRRVSDLPTRPTRGRPAHLLGWVAPAASDVPGPPDTTVQAIRERIVIVIAHRELREYVGGLLRPHYRVQALARGADALRAVAEREPDLVLVDLGGRAADSVEFVRCLRAPPYNATVPALVLSSDTRVFAHADALEAGADDVVAKPFAATELLARAGAQMRLSAQRRALHRRLVDHNLELERQVARRTQALAASEAHFKAVSNLVPGILWRADARGRTEWRSEQWARFTGDDGMGPGLDHVHPDDRARVRTWMTDTVAGRRPAPHEFRLRRHDGAYRWFIARMASLKGPDGAIERWFGSATDIERQQLARHALEAQVDEDAAALAQAAIRQRELLHQLSRSQEDERRRIARELHDSLGQYLTALKLALSALVPAIQDPHLRSHVDRLDRLTTEVDRELDDIIAALRPAVLDELGITGALPVIVADWSRQSGIAAEALLVQIGDERFDDESESTLYRVTQESLTNVAKHARAHHVAVTLARRQGELHLTIEDDGIGFDANHHGSGWGLRGMAERVRSVGGLLQVESTPGGGTTVLVRLPCPR
jgi:PAS domain S-box-containing protein